MLELNPMMSSPVRIVFMGSPDFAVPALRSLANKYHIAGVITQPDRPRGRGRTVEPPPVKHAALELGLPILQPVKLRQPGVFKQLQAWSPDLIVVAAFGQILRQEVLDLPRLGCLNIHASLLPRWRGAAPIQACLLAGDDQTGITIMKLDAGVDTGPILSQRAMAISPGDTASSLFDRLACLGKELLLETLPGYLDGSLLPHPQQDEYSTYAPMLKKEDGFLDFHQPAEYLTRQVRAYNPWPGCFISYNDQSIKIHSAYSAPGIGIPGNRTTYLGKPAIITSQGWLILDEVQPAGRKSMPGKAFLAGTRDWVSTSSQILE